MSAIAPIDDILKRVEQMLDALDASVKSSTDFRDSCHQIERYLEEHKASLTVGGVLSEMHKSRVAMVIERLARLQKRAETRAKIPTGLQKYIAEQSD